MTSTLHRLRACVVALGLLGASSRAWADDAAASAVGPVDDAPGATAADAGALAGWKLGTFRVDSASPMGRRLGVGVQVGWPSSVVGTLMLRPDQALHVGIGAFQGVAPTEPSLTTTAGWLFHPSVLARAQDFSLSWFVGADGLVAIMTSPLKQPALPDARWFRAATQVWTAVRAPLGLDIALSRLPIDLYAEVTPTLLVFPSWTAGLGVDVGARAWW